MPRAKSRAQYSCLARTQRGESITRGPTITSTITITITIAIAIAITSSKINSNSKNTTNSTPGFLIKKLHIKKIRGWVSVEQT